MTFAISRAKLDYGAAAQTEMVLTVRIRDVSKLRVATASLKPLAWDEKLPVAERSQSICGQLFTELWANDERGFPVPQGTTPIRPVTY